MNLVRSIIFLCVALAALAIAPFVMPAKAMTILIEFCAVLALALIWNVLAGFAGLFLMGFQVFIGVGGYVLFVTANQMGVVPFYLLPVAALGGGLLAVAIAPALFRLSGAQLAIGSWVIAEIVRLVVYHTDALGAGGGISLIVMRIVPRVDRLPLTYGAAVLVLVITLLAIVLLMNSKYGLALRAMRDNEVAAEALGVNVFWMRMAVLVIGGALASAAGAAYYLLALNISPTSGFSINWTATILFIVILGGIGTVEGPILGAIIYFALRELLIDAGTAYFIAIGTLAIMVTVFLPGGLWGLVRRLVPFDLLPIRKVAPARRT
ncbi:branched-chain amino acid ABC transporter permease [Devosia sp. FKR38]|uniref:branched-chain amino acid ABC transporter permease n=1 Tax=Devosia sp. FKR38 TaxID=2562312 RepID=UPI0014859A91|nr:branched-chain amino acid ABC transporter permease [Devosia sp. FKR38]